MSGNVFRESGKRDDARAGAALAEIIASEVRRELEGRSHRSLLDYTSGTGAIGSALSDLFDDVVLADASEEMLGRASKVADKPSALDLREGGVDMRADVITVSLVLLHIPDIRPVLASLYDILNPGGRLIIVDFDKNHAVDHPEGHNGFAHEEMRGLMMEAGFRAPVIRTFHHGERIFMKKDASLFLAHGEKPER